ncbi:lumazine synthase [Aphanomyces cochlioides]|nr:lumazine synthase [Aphanomyces cochlioides]
MHAEGVKKVALEALSSRKLDGRGLRIGICTTEWNKEIIDSLREGAVRTLTEAGVAVDDIVLYKVPGAYELPYSASRLIQSENVDAVICIGCLIKGDTMHFEYICEAVTQGIMKLNLETGVPVLFGVLTVLNETQARIRAGLEEGGHNHGVEWAQTAIEMAHLRARTGTKVAKKCPYHVLPACPFMWTTALAVLGYGVHLLVCRKHN